MPHIDLLELPYFADIPLGEVVFLIDAMAPKQLQPGQVAIEVGMVSPALLVTTAGTLIVRGPTPAEARLAAPCALPVRAFFAQAPSPVEAVALSLVSCFALPHETFARLLQARHPAVAPFLRNLLSMPTGLHEGLAVG